jgi:hypothetical protein
MNKGAKPLSYYQDQYGTYPIWGWAKINDPSTGWFANKTSGWTADSFSGGLTVDFSSLVPKGTKAIRVFILQATTLSSVYYRKGSDANISNTPEATGEYSHEIINLDHSIQSVIWLSDNRTVDFAVTNIDTDLYVAYPVEYLI